MPHFTTAIAGTRRALEVDGALEVQEGRKSKGYEVVRPTVIADTLRHAGWDVTIQDDLLDHYGASVRKAKGWAQAITARMPHNTSLPEGYDPVLSMLFDHQGKHAIKARASALRLACTNAFHGEICWRARHDNHDAVRYLREHPVDLFTMLVAKAATPMRRLDALHGVETHPAWRAYWDRAQPRLGKQVREAWVCRYNDDRDMWGMLQACTLIKRHGAQRVADIVLSDAGYASVLEGQVPDVLMAELAKVDVLRLN